MSVVQYNCKSELDSVPISTSKMCLSHRSYLCTLLISHWGFCSLEEKGSTCMALQEAWSMGKDICVQGPRPPASQQDILTFSNNLHFKIKYCHRCLWLVISDLTWRRARGTLGRINMNKSPGKCTAFSHFHHSEFSYSAEEPWKMSIFRTFQNSHWLLLLFLLYYFLSIIYLFVSDTSPRKTYAFSILSNQAFSFSPLTHKHPI